MLLYSRRKSCTLFYLGLGKQSYKNVLIKMDMDFLTLFLSNSEAHKTNNAKMNKVSRIKMDTKGSRFTFYCPEHLKRNHEID